MVPHITHRHRIVRVAQSPIVTNALAETFLSADVSASSGTLTVKDITGFATGKYVWINPFNPNSEIIAVHASTDPSGNTVTLAANTSFAHNANEKVYYVEFNQVEISHASTLAGSKSVLSTESLLAREEELRYLDTSQTSGFYFARFKDSVAATFGSYSDGIAYDGWAKDSVGHMIDRSLRDLKLNLSELITLNDCFNWLTEGMKFIQGKQLRWPEHFSYNTIIGQAQRGINVISLPSDIYDSETNRSIIGVRIGDNKNLIYLDPVTFDRQMLGVKVTQVRTQATSGDTSLAVDNSYDFADTGTLAAYVSGSKDTFTYDGITRDDADGASAAFTSIPSSGDDSIENTLAVDTYIWQDEKEGIPVYFTIRNGSLEFWPLADANEDNANVYMDYAKVATAIDSDIDTIDFHRADMLLDYLRWRMKMKAKNNGDLEMGDHYYIQFKEKMNDAIRTLPPNNKFRMMPRINRMSKRGGRTADLQDLNINDQ